MKHMKALSIGILTVVCLCLIVLSAFLLGKTVELSSSAPFTEQTDYGQEPESNAEPAVSTESLGETVVTAPAEEPRVQILFSGGEADAVGNMPAETVSAGLYTVPQPMYQHSRNRAFGGWHCSLDNGVYHPGELVAVTDANTPVVLTALWRTPEQRITLIEGPDQSEEITLTMEQGETYTLPHAAPVEAYCFVGWKRNQEETLYKAGDMITLTEDAVFTAVYDPVYHTVSFSSGDGGTGSMEPIRVRHGDTITLPAVEYARRYYKTTGWLLDGRLIAPGTETKVTEDQSYVCGWALCTRASWTGTELTINYDSLFEIHVTELLNIEELARAGYTCCRLKLTQLTVPTEGKCDPGVDVYCAKPQNAILGMDGWQGEAYKKTNRVIDSDKLEGLVYNQSQIFYSETLSLDMLLSSGSKLYIHEKARAAYPMDVGKNSMIVSFCLEIEVF